MILLSQSKGMRDNAMATSLNKEKSLIRELSDRLVEIQKPIRILDAIKWDNKVKEKFLKNKGKALPEVNKEYYQKNPLSFDTQNKKNEFFELERQIKRKLGQFSSVGNIMLRLCREYTTALRMLEVRGTKEFAHLSEDLYGSSEDAFYPNAPSLNDLAIALTETIENLNIVDNEKDVKKYTCDQAVKILQTQLNEYFNDPEQPVTVIASDGIIADAAAGADCIKLKQDAMFSIRDLNLLAVHEGWVHVGTTLNGQSQQVCTFLSKGPPSATVNQEGLAVLTEILTFSSYPSRLRRITNRINAIHMASQGANFLEIYHYFIDQNINESESYDNTTRVFRGSTPDGLPFTKDLSYNKGFINVYNYIRIAIKEGKSQHIPLLFLGKTALEDIRVYVDLIEQGIVTAPKYVPPQFSDLAALAAWMCYSLLFGKLKLEKMIQEYKSLF